MKSKSLELLFEKYAEGTAAPGEIKELFALIAISDNDRDMKLYLNNELENIAIEDDYDQEKWAKVFTNIRDKVRIIEPVIKPKKQLLFKRIALAASIVLIASFGLLMYVNKLQDKSNRDYANDIAPGGNKAFLILADGKQITLTGAGNGALADQTGVKITQTADGQLTYKITDNKKISIPEYNTIETPRGGQYILELPDGSKIWLNAASSLKYPATFAGLNQRKVELKGEAYFEISKDKKHPFIVKTDKQEVEVLGTHFNINSYSEELTTKTTLLEGAIQVRELGNKNVQLLKPGQQSILTDHRINIQEVNPNDAVAWKNGKFLFDGDPLEEIMQKISRWYNVEVVFEDGNMRSEKFWGTVSRFATVGQVLKKLERVGEVSFKLENKKIIISKK